MLKIGRASRARMFTATSTAAIAAAFAVTAAHAQDAAVPDALEADIEEVVVTGSRIVNSGFQAPTPVSVLGAASLQAIAPTNIADAVNRLPALAGSTTPRTLTSNISSGALGVNRLNLRALGAERTLVLIDGRRITAGVPDVNNVPNALVSRVEVVTGGASAAYGSDALSGVVNFILDHKFTGLRATVNGGITGAGDNESYFVSVARGTSFGGGRGHVLLSGEFAGNEGISGAPRKWNRNSANLFTNPAYTDTNGLPRFLLAREVGVSNATPGGVITAGPLRGVMFGPGGAPGIFNFGTVSPAGNVMTGGDWEYSRIDDKVDMDPAVRRYSLFGRLSYEVTDSAEIYAEGQYSQLRGLSDATPTRRHGNLTIRSDNPFIPETVAARMAAANITSFNMGTLNDDIGPAQINNETEFSRFTVGATGDFSAMNTEWRWNAYYQPSKTVFWSRARNAGITANYALATDAVRDPSTGAIVCRSTLTNPANGCVAYNPMGIGVNDSRAIDYVTGVSERREVIKQHLTAADISGQPFETWAGPVGVAFGIEHRVETLGGEADPISEATGFFVGNFKASRGETKVTDVFGEVEIPLARDLPWAYSLNVNAAVRGTHYSNSGNVTTWKVGAVYEPVADVRFRTTVSRDIRAPSLTDLFAAGQTVSGTTVVDPVNNVSLNNSFSLSAGNPKLEPEKADGFSAGVVYSPSFIPGFQASVDYYDIDISGAIARPSAQAVVDLCFQGQTELCNAVERTNGQITLIKRLPQNVASRRARGLDFDVSYRLPMSTFADSLDGTLQLRLMATRLVGDMATADTLLNQQATGTVNPGLDPARVQGTASATYSNDRLDFTVSWRYVGSRLYDKRFTECVSNCPVGNRLTIEDNDVKSSKIFDIGFNYNVNSQVQFFGAIDNVLDKAPPLIFGSVTDGYYQGQSNTQYDRIGRAYRAGFRLKM
jgi:iron complex outermembrane receptor protein